MALERFLQLVPTPPGGEDPPLQVAFATEDMHTVNQHFGSARAFAVYAVDKTRTVLRYAVQFSPEDAHHDQLAARIRTLDGCCLVYCQAIGAAAIQRLRERGIQPVRVAQEEPIGTLLHALQETLRQGKVRSGTRLPKDPARFAVMEAEGWDE